MSAYGQIDGGHHTYRRGYLTLPNETAWDPNISYNALGVLAHLMARNPNSPMGYRALLRPGVGEKAILGAFRELVAGGYRMQFKRQIFKPGKRPQMVTDTYHSEDPRPLEWYVEQHKKIYGIEPILIQDIVDLLESSKATLASDSGAHKSGALKRGARKRAAQQKGVSAQADAGEINQGQADAEDAQEPPAADPGLDLINCLGCDASTRRMDLDDRGQCDSCREQQRQEQLEAERQAAHSPEAEAAKLALFQASLERQAKRLHISVEQLLELRANAGHTSAAAVALRDKGGRSAPAHDRSEAMAR